MLRLLFRFAGLVLLAGGFAALVADGTRSVAAGALTQTAFGDVLRWLAPAKFDLIQPTVQRLHPLLWNPVLVHVFAAPAWVVFGAFGMLVLYLGRPPAPQIGYSSRP
jgi:hypothetical protein